MKLYCLRLLAVLCFFFLLQSPHAQEAPFAKDIRAFKKADSTSFPPSHAILFIGSSSFTLWKDVNNYFPGYTIINRGFGGSSLPHLIHYADQIIFPYQPKQVVIYCGENDLNSSDTISAQTVFGRFTHLFTLIRSQLPNVPIAFVSIKPSPSRAHLMPKMEQANSMIKAYLKKQKHTRFVNIYNDMLDKNGKPREELFVEDRLHMNPAGYAIWQKAIRPHLVK